MSSPDDDRADAPKFSMTEAVRKRPAMYVGDTGEFGAYHLLYYALDPAAEHGTTALSVELKSDCTVEISARDCALDIGPLVSAQRRDEFSPTHDLFSVVATLSDPFFIGSSHGRKISWAGRGGLERSDVPVAEPVDGLAVRFAPDPAIFGARTFSFERICARLKELAALYPGMSTRVRDEDTNRESWMQFPDGLAGLVRELGGLAAKDIVQASGDVEGAASVSAAIAFLPVEQPFPQIVSFANGVQTRGGGSHVLGLIDALTNPNDPTEIKRVIAAIAVRAPRELLKFSGPTKDVLAIPGLREGVRDLIRSSLVDSRQSRTRRHP